MTERESFEAQFRICNADGTCQHMDKLRYLIMPKKERKAYREHRQKEGRPANYFGPRGALYCGEKPGLCSSTHCPLRDRT